MDNRLSVLILEDNAADVALIQHELRRSGFDVSVTVADDETSFVAALGGKPDVILADFSLPQFDALRALELLQSRQIDVPLIVVTGHLDDESAVVCVKRGAADFLLKDRLARLGQAVNQALEQHHLRVTMQETERAEAESRQRQLAIFRHTREAMLLADDDGTLIDANPAAEALTGFNRAELLRMKAWAVSQMAGPEQWQRFLSVGNLDGEFEVARRDGATRLTELQAVANIVTGTHLLVLRDITSRRKTEEALFHAQKLESLSVLAGGVAHDFNNLLVAVIGNADLALLDLPPEAPAVDSVRQIKTAARRAADLARQMLALSGRGAFVMEALDLNAVVEEMTHLLKASIAKGAVLRYNLHPNMPLINADATQIRQIIMNLVVNASDAIGDRDGVISITTGSLTADRTYLDELFVAYDLPEGEYIFVEVSDNGSGMSPATVQKIFDPFFTTKFTGRGLGLSAVLGIVRGHAGAIKVYSEMGKGTTFKILFPCVPGEQRNESNTVERDPDWRGSGTVLIADDDESVRHLASRLLERLGFDVVVVEDGEQAVQAFAEEPNRYRLVLVDLTMPHMGGESAFREIRRIRANAPVIIMSGYNEAETTDQFAGKGLSGFVQKPFEFSALRDAVRSALQE